MRAMIHPGWLVILLGMVVTNRNAFPEPDVAAELVQFNNEVLSPTLDRDASGHKTFLDRLPECDSGSKVDLRCMQSASDELVECCRECASGLREATVEAPEIAALRDSFVTYYEAMADTEEARFAALEKNDQVASAECEAKREEVLRMLEKALEQRNRLAAQYSVTISQ